MKTNIIKLIASLAALCGLCILLGDTPRANMVTFAAVKIAGLAILYTAVKVWEHFIPNEEV